MQQQYPQYQNNGYAGQPYPQQASYGQSDQYYGQSAYGAPPPQMAPAQNYAQPQAQPANYTNAGKMDGGLRDDKFAPNKPKWNDLIFALLFYAQFGAFIALSVIGLRALSATGTDRSGGLGGEGSSTTIDITVAYLFALIGAAGLVLSILYLMLVRAATKIILEITLLLSVIMSVGYAAYLWYTKYWSGAVIFTIFAVISIIAYPFMRRRIPFSKVLLQCVMDVANKYKSTYFVAILGTLIHTAYTVWWSFTIAASYQKWKPNAAGSGESGGSASNGALIGICVFLMFSFYWTSQVITNVLLSTEAGIFGSWYFSLDNKLTRPAWGAFKRSMTYSFGSICFGSLIVALLDLLRAGLNIMKQEARSDGDIIGVVCACIAECCIGCIAGLVEYFNRYAYIEISMFGKKYIDAARDAWHLLKDRGIDALVNDSLVNTIWTFGSFVVGGLCCLFAYLYVYITEPSYAPNGSGLYAAILLYAFFIGFFIANTLGAACLSAGVSTIFVALGEEPDALAIKDPRLFEEVRKTYPHVLTAV